MIYLHFPSTGNKENIDPKGDACTVPIVLSTDILIGIAGVAEYIAVEEA